MFKVPNGQNPYSAIGKYIRNHITAIEDMIVVIKINEVKTNQLYMVDIDEENCFIWENDWWEGEDDVTLIDFFPVSEAQHTNQSVQSADLISRQAAIEWCRPEGWGTPDERWRPESEYGAMLKALPSAQPERKKGRWYDAGSLSCRCSECGCKSPKEYSFCPNCGADMGGE